LKGSAPNVRALQINTNENDTAASHSAVLVDDISSSLVMRSSKTR
jgi:hypothetical protein